jgi:spermidine synthase
MDPMAGYAYPIRSDKLGMTVKVDRVLCDVTSPFQRIEIVETQAFGRTLFLDGHIQLTELDEAAYHECLVQIPLLSMNSPKRALVIGGGDGGVIREILKHASIESVDMLEIDPQVIDACRKHMPFLNRGAFEDPRLHLVIGDAFENIKALNPGYDLIIADATDIYEEEEGELSEALFTEEFYVSLQMLLTERGLLVTQADNLLFCPYSLEDVMLSFDSAFPSSGSYWGIVPSYGGFSGFAWAGRMGGPKAEWPGSSIPLAYLNPTTWALAFSPLPFCS